MAAREFYCRACREWHPVLPSDGIAKEARKRHAHEHDAATEMFDRLDLIEFDGFMIDMYGGGS